MTKKLWGGRFSKGTNEAVEEFTASISVDSRLWEADIRGSVAHATMLGKTGVIPKPDADTIVEGLNAVHEDLATARSSFKPTAEDVHSEIERLLSEKIGPVAGKLHTARSRNDQVATASRLYLRGEVTELLGEIRALQTQLTVLAEVHTETVMPGLTHMQHAQPVSLAHHLLAYFWMFQRDHDRLVSCSKRINVMPLGSAALAGTSFPLDRELTAAQLGFDQISENSLDAVSDRDFVVEFLSNASLAMTHLSQLAQELVLWSTPEYGFVELDDTVTTGSSIMPQKKNPDVAELIRGKTGRVSGALIGALTMLKALPLSYNRDLQEDKTFLFEGLDTVRGSLRLMKIMLENAAFKTSRMAAAVRGDFSNATDLADYLARKGIPFRQCHEIVGAIVRDCLAQNLALEDLDLPRLRTYSPLFESDIIAAIQPLAVMRARTTPGGTSPASVREQLQKAKELLR